MEKGGVATPLGAARPDGRQNRIRDVPAALEVEGLEVGTSATLEWRTPRVAKRTSRILT